MNIRAKIAVGTAAGLVAGASVMGAAFAAPRALLGPATPGYRMMGSATTSGTVGIPTVAEMQTFMQKYRTSSGAVDVNRMHADVASGKVTPPCVDGSTRGAGRSSADPVGPRQGAGFGMMGGTY